MKQKISTNRTLVKRKQSGIVYMQVQNPLGMDSIWNLTYFASGKLEFKYMFDMSPVAPSLCPLAGVGTALLSCSLINSMDALCVVVLSCQSSSLLSSLGMGLPLGSTQ